MCYLESLLPVEVSGLLVHDMILHVYTVALYYESMSIAVATSSTSTALYYEHEYHRQHDIIHQ